MIFFNLIFLTKKWHDMQNEDFAKKIQKIKFSKKFS